MSFSCKDCAWFWLDDETGFEQCHRNDGKCVEDDIEDERRAEEERRYWRELEEEYENSIDDWF